MAKLAALPFLRRENGWLDSTEEDRRDLYFAIRRVKELNDLTWNDIFREVFGDSRVFNSDIERNMRRGKYARVKANQLYEWLCDKHPSIAGGLHYWGKHYQRFQGQRNGELRDIEDSILGYAHSTVIKIDQECFIYRGADLAAHKNFYIDFYETSWIIARDIETNKTIGIGIPVDADLYAQIGDNLYDNVPFNIEPVVLEIRKKLKNSFLQ